MRIAIIGLGVMGKNHYRVIQNIPSLDVVALCDAAGNKDGFSEPFYTDVDELLKCESFDAALIAVPTFLHKQIALKCIGGGKDLFIEKPVASNVQEAREILSASSKAGVKVCVGYVERFNPVVTALKNELNGREIYSINITRVGPFPPRIADVGVLTDLSVHDIDLLRFISSQEIKNSAIFKSKKIHNHHEDNAILSFELGNEIVANITTNWLTPFRKRKIEVATARGYFEADLMEQTLTEYSAYKENFSYVLRKCMVKKAEPLQKELEEFAKFLQSGNLGDLSSIEDSMITLEVSSSAN